MIIDKPNGLEYTTTLLHKSLIINAEVVEWQTRRSQKPVPRGVRVQLPPSALFSSLFTDKILFPPFSELLPVQDFL